MRRVSLHAPVLDETRGMTGARQMKLLRDGAFLIDTARAAIFDHAARLERLRTGTITAALDVFETEPLPDDGPFRTAPGIFLSTPRPDIPTIAISVREESPSTRSGDT